MKHRLIALGATGSAVALAAVMVTAQSASPREARDARGDREQTRTVEQSQGRQQRGQLGRGGTLQRRGPAFGPGFGGPGRGMGGGVMALNLSDEQRTKIAALHRTGRERSEPLRKELETARDALHQELYADARDARKLGELSARVAALEQQLADVHLRTAAGVADLLTAEQRATLRDRHGRGGRGGWSNGPRGRGPAAERGPQRIGGGR